MKIYLNKNTGTKICLDHNRNLVFTDGKIYKIRYDILGNCYYADKQYLAYLVEL